MKAIDVLKYLLEKAESETPEEHRIVGVNVPVDIVREIIDAQPERKRGKWLEYNATGKKQWMCSECCAEEKNPKVARFCYWCGADMRGEQDDEQRSSKLAD